MIDPISVFKMDASWKRDTVLPNDSRRPARESFGVYETRRLELKNRFPLKLGT